nr:probable LRR receptor-like serine/threonine-protein kinase At1g53430 isoform X1 [Ipomoea batatas]
MLKGLSLPGVLPPDFAKLRFLRQLSLLGNRISGKIPKEIGDISTLEQLVLEDNELQGPLDENLGRLSNLNRLLLSANNITGGIPETFGNLKNLTDLIDGNPISGKVPNFIGNWTQLKTLVLRNCSIADTIPKYIGDMSKLKTLDLSFNMMNGKIPTAMGKKIEYVFLAHNMLSGDIPRWTLESKDSIDLSYNNLTESSPTGCQASNHSLFINCGGGRTEFEDNTYDEDFNNEGPSYFSASSDRWAYSSSGLFISNDIAKYVAANTFSSNVIKDDIYKTARLAPTSLAYYGFCMKQGSYKVVLHFAEIMFSNDSTYSSLGRRLFDVKIQGKVVLTDFNIVEEAKGAGIGITKVFDDTGYFTLRQVKAATNNFDLANKIGEGGFGPVYKGVLSDGVVIAVKQLSSKSNQGNREFINEIGMITALQHPNLVKLHGCCIEGNQLLLIYEYMENNCLSRALFGYMAPEYAMRGYLTDKADVYSFGIVTLEIVSGKSNTNYRPKEEFVYLLDWAYVQEEQGNLLDLVDQSLGSNYPKEEALMMLKLALLCANPSPTLRPSMVSVVKMLNGQIPVQAPAVGPGKSSDDLARFKAFKKLSHDSHTTNSSSTISKDSNRQLQRSISLGAPWTGSSNSFPSRDGYQDCSSTTKLLPDLYNVNLE